MGKSNKTCSSVRVEIEIGSNWTEARIYLDKRKEASTSIRLESPDGWSSGSEGLLCGLEALCDQIRGIAERIGADIRPRNYVDATKPKGDPS